MDEGFVRAEQLGRVLRDRAESSADAFVLCHGDLHPGNVLLGAHGELTVVDWDNPMLAPKECDLLLLGGGVGPTWNDPRQDALFFEGYAQPSETRRAQLLPLRARRRGPGSFRRADFRHAGRRGRARVGARHAERELPPRRAGGDRPPQVPRGILRRRGVCWIRPLRIEARYTRGRAARALDGTEDHPARSAALPSFRLNSPETSTKNRLLAKSQEAAEQREDVRPS